MALFSGTDNIIAALGRRKRVCRVINLELASWQVKDILATMQVPFPQLASLSLSSYDEMRTAIPDSFLDGSAPNLQYFSLSGIPFPGLPNLLLSANHLANLDLSNIPHSGYISPEVIVALLSALSKLRQLSLGFRSPQSRPDWQSRNRPPRKRLIRPALRKLHFKGITEYLEELVAGIDTPQLDELHITFFNQIDFHCPQLVQFIDRTPMLRDLNEAHVQFDGSTASVKLRYRTSQSGSDGLEIAISCKEPDWQLSSIEQVCNSSSHRLSTVEDLYFEPRYPYYELVWKNDAIENTLWLQLLHPFTAVKNRYLSKEFASAIAAALRELVEGGITEVLPCLQNISVQGLESLGPVQENIGQFVASRQLSGHPIAISVWRVHFS